MIEAYAQESSGSSHKVSTFTIQNELTNISANTVNLSTGDVSMSLPLVSVSSQTGLDASITLFYNSTGIQHFVRTWNLDAPTSCVGLGWNLFYPKIVSNHKGTGTIIDDQYFLFDRGSTTELLRISNGSDSKGIFYTFKLKNNPFWQIKFYSDLSPSNKNTWEIVTEEGIKYTYGGNDSRKTIQYMVNWDNWVGNSSLTTGQSQMAVAWNLSETENIWGQKLIYEYLNQDNRVGIGGLTQTEASYLKSITNPEGIKIDLKYAQKLPSWFMEPHIEASEPDGYQEFYEKNLLDYVEVRGIDGFLLKKIDLSYSNLEYSNSINKMVLSSIQEVAENGNSLKPFTFEYYTNNSENSFAGFLWKITNSLGGSSVYNYKIKPLFNSSLQCQVEAPIGYAEAKTWIGNDYVIVAWRDVSIGHLNEPTTVKIYLYHWVGYWKSKYLGTINNVRTEGINQYQRDYVDFFVLTEEKYFVIQHIDANKKSKLLVCTKEINVDNETLFWKLDEYESQLHSDTQSGNSLITGGENFFLRGFYKGASAERFTFNGKEWVREYLNLFNGHYLFRAGINYFIAHDEYSDKFYFNFLDAERNWHQREFPENLKFYSSGISYWNASASFLMVMAKDNPEFIYRWSKDFNNFYKDTNASDNSELFGSKPDDWRVFIVNNATVGLYGRLVRFDGLKWNPINYTFYEDGISKYSFYGEDYCVRNVSSNNAKMVIYNPNTRSFIDLPQLMEGELYKTAVSSNSFVLDNKIYFRNRNGNWENVSNVTNTDGYVLNIGNNSYAFFTNYPFEHEKTFYIKNGLAKEKSSTYQFLHYSKTEFKNRGASNNIFISHEWSSGSNYYNMYNDSRKLYINWANYENYSESSHLFNQVDYVVDNIVSSNGEVNTNTKFIFYNDNSYLDVSGFTAFYSQIDVVPNATSEGLKTKGYIRHNLFTKMDLQGTYLQGVNFKTSVFDQNDSLVSQKETFYDIKVIDFNDNFGRFANQGFVVRVKSIKNKLDGISKQADFFYDEGNGRTKEIKEYFHNIDNYVPIKKDIVTRKFRFAHEFYPALVSKNILGITVISETYNDRLKLINSEVKTLKFYGLNQIPMIHRSFNWSGFETSLFNAWDESVNPQGQWKLDLKIDNVDLATGLIKEKTNQLGVKHSTLWDYNKKLPLAVVSNANSNQFIYEGFESASNNFANDAFSGNKSSTSILNILLPSQGTFTLSWWQKEGANNWKYMEQVVSANATIGGTGLLIDEVRLLPQNADMTTYAYDNRGNKISECDANNNCMHYEYDEFNRVKNIRDNNKNIIENKVYQLN